MLMSDADSADVTHAAIFWMPYVRLTVIKSREPARRKFDKKRPPARTVKCENRRRSGSVAPMLAHHTAAGKVACVLVNLGATVAGLGALFVAAFGLCLWALGRSEVETPAYVLNACHEGTPGCVLAAFWNMGDVLACLFAVSFCLFHMVLMLLHPGGPEPPDDDDIGEWLEEEAGEGLEEEAGEESRGRASASSRLVRRVPRSPADRGTTAEQVTATAEQVRGMARGTARPPPLPVLPEMGAAANAQQPGMGRSAVPPKRAPTLRRAPQGTAASRSQSSSPSRSTWPRWGLRDAVLVSLSRLSGPPGGARRSSPTGGPRRGVASSSSSRTGRSRRRVSSSSSPTGRSRRDVSSGALFYENVVLRQIRERALQANDSSSDDGGGS